jgi:LppX_LprAFG lipoprotein
MRRALLALLALPLATAACGGAASTGSNDATMTPIAYVKSAAVKTQRATSEHMALRGTITVSGQVVTVKSDGDFDNASHAGSMTVQFNAGAFEGSIDEVIDGTTVYMRSPLFADALPKGKSWVKLDLAKAAAAKGLDVSSLGAQSPTQTLAQLGVLTSVTEVGDEQVGGADTTHYRGRVTKLPQPKSAAAKAFLAGAKYGPYDVWVGKDDGYVRRVSFSFATASKQAISLTSDFSDFGKDVSVTVPAETETVDATNKTIQGLGG